MPPAESLSCQLELMLARCHHERPRPTLAELEELYTSGCAHAIALEGIAARSPRASTELSELRDALRDLKPALDWLRAAQGRGHSRILAGSS